MTPTPGTTCSRRGCEAKEGEKGLYMFTCVAPTITVTLTWLSSLPLWLASSLSPSLAARYFVSRYHAVIVTVTVTARFGAPCEPLFQRRPPLPSHRSRLGFLASPTPSSTLPARSRRPSLRACGSSKTRLPSVSGRGIRFSADGPLPLSCLALALAEPFSLCRWADCSAFCWRRRGLWAVGRGSRHHQHHRQSPQAATPAQLRLRGGV